MSYASHKEESQRDRSAPIRCAIVTVSDTRDEASDRSGAYLRDALAAVGHEVVAYHIVRDDPAAISSMLDDLIGRCEVILTNGGTGISRRDTTIEVVSEKLVKVLPGFGELFRMLSYREIGAGAMLSRAVAGLAGKTLIVAMPGSTNAVRLAVEELVLPEIEHLVWEVVRQQP